jgi:hypothetical protein
MDPRARLDDIRGLLEAGESDEAAGALVSLWGEMADPSGPWRALRASLLARYLARAAASGPDARARIVALRSEVSPPEGPDPGDAATVREWCTLNIVLDQADRTLSWLDRVETDPEAVARLRPLAGFLPYILRQAGRWPDIARWFPDPGRSIRAAYGAARAWLEQHPGAPAAVVSALRAFPRDRAALVYAGLLAAGRDEEAESAAELALSLDEDGRQLRLKLVSTAVEEAGQARERHLLWMASEEDRGEWAMELREKVVAALADGERGRES